MKCPPWKQCCAGFLIMIYPITEYWHMSRMKSVHTTFIMLLHCYCQVTVHCQLRCFTAINNFSPVASWDNIVFIRSILPSHTFFRLQTCRLFVFRHSSLYEWVIESFIKQINYTNSNDSLHLPTSIVWVLFSQNAARLHISTVMSSSPIKGHLNIKDP